MSTVALVTLTLAPHGDSVRLTGVVDSFTVTRGEGIPTPTDSAPRRAQFVATLAPDGRVTAFRRADTGRAVAGHADTNRVDTSRSDTARADTGHVDRGVAGARGCVSSLGPLLGVARDALAPAPVALSVGQTWRDSSTVVTCHGGVEITAITVSDYRVEGSETHASIPAIRLSRTSTTAHTGGGVDHGRALSLTGTGTGRATLYLDAATGALLTSTAESETTLTFGTPREQAGFRQSVRQSVRLVGDR